MVRTTGTPEQRVKWKVLLERGDFLDEDVQMYRCTECGYQSTNKLQILKHLKSHTGDKHG